MTPIVLPHSQEGFAAYCSRVFKSRFCFATFNVGGLGLANNSKHHNGNEVFHRLIQAPTPELAINDRSEVPTW